MRTIASWTRNALIGVAACALLAAAPRAQATDVASVLARIGERVTDYYRRAQNIICTEKVFAQPMDFGYRADGMGRSLEYELHLEADGIDGDGLVQDAKVARELRKINGRAPRKSDQDNQGCLDPQTHEPEPLAFLLPANQKDFTFTSAARGTGKEKDALIVEFVHKQDGTPEIKTDKHKRPECFQISLPVTMKGRVLVDSTTFDVLRVEEELAHRVDIRVPYEQQRSIGLPDYVVVERLQTITKYAVVKFKEPEESLVLPASIEEVAIMRGAGSHRKRQEFSDYRRFLTGGRIIKEPGAE
ncbi:MAG TPA: hypothetical protein VFA59_16745 [Vicinamibacterales bacterium]|nr:hypothetical protein [Vicinamibacterales bacterium]